VRLQELLPKWIDGDFGTTTESLVKEFQRSEGLEVDGVVGEQTWAALLDEEPPPNTVPVFGTEGPCSWFGGPNDTGVAPDEGLAFITDISQAPHLFLPYQPSGTTGLARRLNPDVSYVACRWDYSKTPKDMLREGEKALVRSKKSGYEILAYPADWGPHEDTGRVADLSPALADALKLQTDDEVDVIYPAP